MTQAHNLSGQTYNHGDGESNGNNKNIQTRDERPIMIGQNGFFSHICEFFHFGLGQKQPLNQADINRNLSNTLKNCPRSPSYEKKYVFSKKMIIRSLPVYENMAASKKCL